jgi:hypothetical protein
MRNRHRVRALLIPLMAATFVLTSQLPAFAPGQSVSDVVIYPLAICRDGIRFQFFADYYPAGTGDPTEEEEPFRIQSVQAAAPVPEPDANGRLVPPADTLVLDTTLSVPYTPQQLDFDAYDPPPMFPKYPPQWTISGPYPQPEGLQDVNYYGDYTLAWSRKLEPGPAAVALSFDRFDPTSDSQEVVADVDPCKLF